MRRYTIAFMAAVALSASAAVLAQQQMQHPDMVAMRCGGGMGGRMSEMMKGHAMGGSGHPMMYSMMGIPSPAMILHHKDDLALSGAQVTQLENLQNQVEPGCKHHMQAGINDFRSANQLLDAASPDFGAYSAKLKEGSMHMVEAHVALAKAAVGARDVLTAAQRDKMKSMMAQMHAGKRKP